MSSLSGVFFAYHSARDGAANRDDANAIAARAVERLLSEEDQQVYQGKYRAIWIADSGDTAMGEFTTLEDAVREVKFLKKYRAAWVEDVYGESVDYKES